MPYRLKKYINYRRKARNEYSLHSPFMFDLYNAVFKKARKKNAAFQDIENLRKVLLKNHAEITVTDLGAGPQRSTGTRRKISDITRNTSKSPKYARFMALLAQYLEHKNIVELGTSVGISTAYLARAHANAHVFSIEGCPEIHALACKNFEQLHLQNIDAVCAAFDEALPPLLGKNKSFDLLYIDGNHTYEATLRYFDMALTHAGNNSVIIFDDIYWSEGMTKAWEKIITHEAITASVDAFEFGIVFFRKELHKQHFILKL